MNLWGFGRHVDPSYILWAQNWITEGKRNAYRLRSLVKGLCIIYTLISKKIQQQLHTAGDAEV